MGLGLSEWQQLCVCVGGVTALAMGVEVGEDRAQAKASDTL